MRSSRSNARRRQMFWAPAVHALISSVEFAMAVAGISCITPSAPLGDTASVAQRRFDQRATLSTSEGGSPLRSAASRTHNRRVARRWRRGFYLRRSWKGSHILLGFERRHRIGRDFGDSTLGVEANAGHPCGLHAGRRGCGSRSPARRTRRPKRAAPAADLRKV